MLLLAIDTSGRNGSVALARGDSAQTLEILELLPLAGRMYSAQLIPQIKVALERHQLTKRELDAFAVASGPGSFTGLRVGLSTVKALAEVLQKPIAAVSVLQAAARLAGCYGHVIVALDAGRQQVFAGDYEIHGNGEFSSRQELLLPLNDFLHSVSERSAVLATPDASVANAAQGRGLSFQEIASPQADTIARLGLEQLRAGQSVAPEALEPNYLRPSDAELFSLPKLRQ
ncbi:MAG TPA: tRNA (adenosine(37)-N6)-threonylcarbamoyltransferase complex dimerization subunit type 1 TsaB [Terriglobales bacterium]|nr:tRNA (adenosine(37)-N6)-threonylcarbamoyltransferase complex dimerization subunit type 1 TsaB [Terriglobales bacterium]